MISTFFIQIQFNKRNDEESMICLTPKPSHNISEVIDVSSWLPPSSHIHTLDYAIRGVWENKTNITSHPNIASLKTAIEEEWNKMANHFFKTCKSFRRRVDTMIEKMAALLSKFTVLCLSSYFVVYFLRLKLILFYNRVV